MLTALSKIRLLWTLCLSLITILCPLFSEVRDFQVFEVEKDGTCTKYLPQTVKGTERMNLGLNRLSMLSEDQASYPTPESGCGPTAMLNILIWYEKFGLIPPLYRDADPRHYKLKLFREIDHRLAEQSGTTRTEEIGVRNLDAAIVMESIVNERTKGALRVHTDFIEAPLKLKDFLKTTKNFRSGYLIVKPKDPRTGKLLSDHAVVVIRTDRTGYITLATWGQRYHGLIRKRYDGQWFIPQDPKHLELKIKALTRFTPFRLAQQ
ncbi:MAG: hypothetical protein ACJAT5_000602 [Lentimonas sp.]|jgi:hypothetical protein